MKDLSPAIIILFSIVLVIGFVYLKNKGNSQKGSSESTPSPTKKDQKATLTEYVSSFKDALSPTQKDYIQIHAKKIKSGSTGTLSRNASKFGGIPYFPKGAAWPVDSNGKPLFFLAQVNFSEVPTLENFPEKGILQFYIGNDEVFGMKFSKDPFDSEYAVKFYEPPEVLSNNSETTEFKESTEPKDTLPKELPKNEYAPFSGEFELTFTKASSYVSLNDYKFDDIIPDKDFLEEINYDESNVVEKALGLPLGNNSNAKHQLGGYPYFTQWDPRDNNAELKALESSDNEFILLFQMDSQLTNNNWEIIFGDAGVMNFFIRKQDLINRDFSKVFYTWDCS